jgi:hypothetical protein
MDALRKCVLVDRRLPALGHRLQHPRVVQQRERQRVSDAEHPVECDNELHLLAQHHDERVGLDAVRLPLRGSAEHVARASLDGRHVHQRQCVDGRQYSQKSFSLAGWRGQTVRLQFRATTDFSLPTSFRIDDVSLR